MTVSKIISTFQKECRNNFKLLLYEGKHRVIVTILNLLRNFYVLYGTTCFAVTLSDIERY